MFEGIRKFLVFVMAVGAFLAVVTLIRMGADKTSEFNPADLIPW